MAAVVLDLAVVTSCSGGYGQYLGEWAASLLASTVRPTRVVILTHGSEADQIAGTSATAVLVAHGLEARSRHIAEAMDLGAARNLAVELAGPVEWVMHLDADDTLMPHALGDVEAIAPEADVVCLGYERTGDLASGPKNRRKLYRSSTGLGALENPTPASGVSPFRRSLWLQAPYRTDLIGGWDTALWIGFARLGARFRPTNRPAFWYRQHRDSVFNLRRLSGWPAARAGVKLQSLRRGDEGVAIVVPRAGDGGGPRDRAWDWLRARLGAFEPSWAILEGKGDEAAWCKGAAVMEAVRSSSAAILVVADGDCVLPAGALEEAVELVASGRAPWVVPHTMVYRLTEGATDLVLQQPPGDPVALRAPVARPAYTGFAGGGVLVVPRAEFELIGGIPREFVGWGAEDEALAVILDTLLGPHVRLGHDLVHLWHPPQRERAVRRSSPYMRNRELYRRYAAFAGLPEQMWQAVHGAGPAGSPYYSPRGLVEERSQRMRDARNQAEASVRDRFAERRLALAAVKPREGDHMAGALAVRRQHALLRKQQDEMNRVALEKGEADRKALLSPLPNKMLGGHANKARGSAPAKIPGGDVEFASAAAEKLARAEKLSLAELQLIEPGPNGITIEQVRAAAGL